MKAIEITTGLLLLAHVASGRFLDFSSYGKKFDSGRHTNTNGIEVDEAEIYSYNPGRVDFLTKPENIITQHGYPFEEYEVTTSDGYILTVHRIPGSERRPPRPGKSVVFLQHGVLMSSSDFVVGGPYQGLGFILADAGYDVWLGNARGNTYSRKHLHLSPNQKQFWEFSWHEIGQSDLPAMIDFALNKTGESKLHYIGHSQGTTAFFVMGALDVEEIMMSKIKSMHALAPIAFMSRMKSPFIRAIAPFARSAKQILNMLGIHEFFPSTKMITEGGYYLCRDESIIQEVCTNVMFLICGYDSVQLNRTMLPAFLRNTPAGSSVDQLVHYAQGINSGKFRMFDYGTMKNLKLYGSFTPPEYDLNNVKAPVALHYSDNDWMAAVEDVDTLAEKLPNLIKKIRIKNENWNHLDYVWAMQSKLYVYDTILDLMNRFE